MNAINWLIWAYCVRQFIADVLQRNPRISLAFFWAQESRVKRSILVLAGVVLKVEFPGNEVQPKWFFYGGKYFEYKAEKYSKYLRVLMEAFGENHEKLFGLNRMLRRGVSIFFSLKYFNSFNQWNSWNYLNPWNRWRNMRNIPKNSNWAHFLTLKFNLVSQLFNLQCSQTNVAHRSKVQK